MPKVDLAKRRRIMQRSMKLGHCICDPSRPCPCPVFQEQGICPCAGERPDPIRLEDVHLTRMVHNAGCASKIAPADLEAVLRRLPRIDDPAVLCGMPAGDDAGLYRLDDKTVLVQTVDVMTPCVDEPRTFGRICAANCLSDVYAMGSVPRTALSILGFPAETHDGRIMYEMMRGAMDVFAEADVALIGGHSIKDEEIKLGFAITGTISLDAVARRDTAEIGDELVLTKPLGCGVLNFARQIGRPVNLTAAEASMATLNRAAAEAMNEVAAHACTDVTGFGLFGHLAGMVRGAGVTAHLWADRFPALDGAVDLLADGVVPGAIERNTEFVAEDITFSNAVPESLRHLGFDAQTSGGLLIAVPPDKQEALLAGLRRRAVDGWVVGRIVDNSAGRIQVTLAEEDADAAPRIDHGDESPHATPTKQSSCCGSSNPPEAPSAGCCAPAEQTPQTSSRSCCSAATPDRDATATSAGSASVSQEAFGALMQSTTSAGLLDERTKELVNFALVLLSKCEPCFAVHWDKARNMGISPEELDEVAWCAVGMGGAPVRMFHQQMLDRLNRREPS